MRINFIYAQSTKKRKSGSETFKVVGPDGQVTIVTKTVVPACTFPAPEKFKKANEILEKTIMLPE